MTIIKRKIALYLALSCFYCWEVQAMPIEAHENSISTLHEQYMSGTLTPDQVLKKSLETANQFKNYNFFITLNSKSAILAAHEATLLFKNKKNVGPLQGIPVVIKDNIDVEGIVTTDGTPSLISNKAKQDATIVRKLRQAGAIILGKTNMHELAMGATSNNFYFGAVHNPYAYEKFAGGSSGGTAAAIAAGIVSIGIGTDTAGSTRIPAALSGIVGFRPTIYRYAMDGVVPVSKTLDTVGLMARKVSDIILLDQLLTDKSIQKVEPYPLKGLRIGVPRHSFLFEDLDPETKEITDIALKKLADNGVELIEMDFKMIPNIGIVATYPIVSYEMYNDLPVWLDKYSPKVTIEQLITKIASPDIKSDADEIWKFLIKPQLYNFSLLMRTQLLGEYIKYFKQYTIAAVVFPTTPLPARNVKDSVFVVDLNGKKVDTATAYTRNTIHGATAGIPGLSIPIGLTRSGLPVGLEIDGLNNEDMKILQIGLAMESIFGHLTTPVLSGAHS